MKAKSIISAVLTLFLLTGFALADNSGPTWYTNWDKAAAAAKKAKESAKVAAAIAKRAPLKEKRARDMRKNGNNSNQERDAALELKNMRGRYVRTRDGDRHERRHARRCPLQSGRSVVPATAAQDDGDDDEE